MQNIEAIEELSVRQTRSLKRFVAGALVAPIPAVESDMIDQLRSDLAANPPVVVSVPRRLVPTKSCRTPVAADARVEDG
jgi:hypothetical protein